MSFSSLLDVVVVGAEWNRNGLPVHYGNPPTIQSLATDATMPVRPIEPSNVELQQSTHPTFDQSEFGHELAHVTKWTLQVNRLAVSRSATTDDLVDGDVD